MNKRKNKPYNVRLKLFDTDIVTRSENLREIIKIMTLDDLDHESVFFGNKLLFNNIKGQITYFNVTERQKTIINNLINAKINSNK
jgi:hypothetical protein